MAETTIYFVRHGLVENPAGIFYGRLPRYRLSTAGIAQVRALEPFFHNKPVVRIYTSPLLRTRQTGQILSATKKNAPISTSSLLVEVKTPYDGQPLSAMEAIHWDLYSGTPPPYEQPEDILARGVNFIEHVWSNFTGKQVIAVTHADLIVFLSLWSKGYEVSYRNKARLEKKELELVFPQPASVTTFSLPENGSRPDYAYFQPEGSAK